MELYEGYAGLVQIAITVIDTFLTLSKDCVNFLFTYLPGFGADSPIPLRGIDCLGVVVFSFLISRIVTAIIDIFNPTE